MSWLLAFFGISSGSLHIWTANIPSQLPVSCLTVAPRADKLEKAVGRKPLLEFNVICELDINGHI